MLTDERIYILMEKARSYRLDGGMKLNLARLVEAEVRKEQADQIAELTRQLEAARKDSERLDWMIFHSAHISHTSDAEYCSAVWSDDEGDERATNMFGCARAAIDAAITAKEQP